MTIRTILFIVLLLAAQQLFSAENLVKSDFVGSWASDWTAVENEKQYLEITPEFSSIFQRRFESEIDQRFETESIEFVDDLILIKYKNEANSLVYKLALSGWKSGGTKKLYGTMFMYKDGKQYNGLPVSFKFEKLASNKSLKTGTPQSGAP